jgi:hypothetical protein
VSIIYRNKKNLTNKIINNFMEINMTTDEYDRIIRIYEETENFLSSSVKISWQEVSKLVVNDLIEKRNACNDERQEAFDIVLRYYLDNEEFEKYVINKQFR